jgi:hypothetical protein
MEGNNPYRGDPEFGRTEAKLATAPGLQDMLDTLDTAMEGLEKSYAVLSEKLSPITIRVFDSPSVDDNTEQKSADVSDDSDMVLTLKRQILQVHRLANKMQGLYSRIQL